MRRRIFISYSKEEPEPTTALAALLSSEGYDVWWDSSLTPGEVFREVIDRELDAAHAVIVIWTPASITSNWVISEADHASRQGKLITVRTVAVDPSRIPKPYNTYHTDTIDNRAAILAAIRRVTGRPLEREGERISHDAIANKARRLRPHKSPGESAGLVLLIAVLVVLVISIGVAIIPHSSAP